MALDREFGFTVDIAASGDNALVPSYVDLKTDGIAQDWSDEVVWLNPPYKYVASWVAKARREAHNGAVVVCLVPARVDTEWWNAEVVPFATEIRFIRGRLRFDDQKNSAPFPSAVIVFSGVVRSPGDKAEVVTINPDGSPYVLPLKTDVLL